MWPQLVTDMGLDCTARQLRDYWFNNLESVANGEATRQRDVVVHDMDQQVLGDALRQLQDSPDSISELDIAPRQALQRFIAKAEHAAKEAPGVTT